jgi:hypothetical protein
VLRPKAHDSRESQDPRWTIRSFLVEICSIGALCVLAEGSKLHLNTGKTHGARQASG